MNREQLDERHTAAIQHHLRTITDNSGQLPQQLLDELASIANLHAKDCVAAAEDQFIEHDAARIAVKGDTPESAPLPKSVDEFLDQPESGTRRPRPRTTARRTAK